MAKTISIIAYAKHRGVSRQAVYDAITAGRIEREPDKKIDPVKADKQWGNLTGRPRGNGKPAAAPPPDIVEPDLPKTEMGRLRGRQEEARMSKLEAEAVMEGLDAKERVGELVNRSLAREAVFQWFRGERDAWRNFPARFSAQIAAELQTQDINHRTMITALEKYVDLYLEERGDIEPPDFTSATG